MSIINNVLRDLELRSSQFTPIGVTSAGAVVTSKPRQFVPAMLGFLLFSTIVIGFWFYQQGQPHFYPAVGNLSNIGTVEAAPELEAVVAAEVLPLVIDQPAMNQLIGMQFRESNDAISLEFSLREKVVSYLKERSENGFVFHLKDIDSEIVAPLISDNRWIERLTITPQAGGLDISLATLAGVLVETQQQKIENELVWAIKLKKLPESVDKKPVPIVQRDQSSNISIEAEESTPQLTTLASAKTEVSDGVDKAKLVKLEIISRNTSSEEVQQLQKARRSIQRRQFKKAETGLLKLLGGTQDLATRESLLVVYKSSKQQDSLGNLISESMMRYPQHGVFITEHAHSLFQQSAYQQVIDLLQSRPNQNASQLALVGASYQRLDQHQAAASFYSQSLKVDASQSRNWIALGLSEEHNANLQQALTAYRTAKKKGNLNTRLIEFVDQRSRILEKVIN